VTQILQHRLWLLMEVIVSLLFKCSWLGTFASIDAGPVFFTQKLTNAFTLFSFRSGLCVLIN